MSSAWITIARASTRYAVSGVRGIPRSKGTAARAVGLVIKFERANAVEDIMTEARGPPIGLMVQHECAMPSRHHSPCRLLFLCLCFLSPSLTMSLTFSLSLFSCAPLLFPVISCPQMLFQSFPLVLLCLSLSFSPTLSLFA